MGNCGVCDRSGGVEPCTRLKSLKLGEVRSRLVEFKRVRMVPELEIQGNSLYKRRKERADIAVKIRCQQA